MKRTKLICIAASIGLLVACSQAEVDETKRVARGELSPTPLAALSVTISSPAANDVITGNTLELGVESNGVEIMKANGDGSGKTGHYHVFIDRDPVAVGEVIPTAQDIVHAATNPILIPGIAPGTHRFTVVLGDGNHKRIGDVSAELSVEFDGPSIEATASRSIEAGDVLTVRVRTTGLSLVEPPQGEMGKSGHLHALVDVPFPEYAKAIPATDNIIHFSGSTVEIPNLTAGEHEIFIVVGDGGHVPFRPLVADRLLVTVK